MTIRIITAIVALCAFVPMLIFSETVAFPIAGVILCAVAVFEMLRCCGLHRRFVVSVPMIAASAFVFLPFVFRDRTQLAGIGMTVAMILVLYLLTCMVFSRGKIPLQEVAVPFFSCFYVIAAFTAMILLRYCSADGKYLYLVSFLGAWVTDTFAYFSGRLFGKHPLIPEVSPKKTVEGSIGGALFCVLAMLLYGWIVSKISAGAVRANYLMLAVSGLVITLVSQIGDLSMSAIKRIYGIKDYGKLFPGHGGVLDRFDSVLAVAMVLTVLSSFGNLFTMV